MRVAVFVIDVLENRK